jgi:rod shape determining protein RodA
LVLLLVAVLLVGVGPEDSDVKRWLVAGPVRFQPSEQSKLALIFMLAWYLSSIGRRIERLRYFLLTFLISAVPLLLILKQPSLGTAVTLIPITFAMLYMAGCRRVHLVGIIIIGIGVVPIVWSLMKDYQRLRVMTILDPGSDALGAGYHTIQSMITVGSGGLSGKGFMEGTQTYLSYLPEHHTDFIFSLLAEEWGFLGSVTVVMLFLILFLRSLQVAENSQDMAGSLLAVGIVTLLAFHVFVNIAITLGIAPVTGIPLPFLSYGRSFYLTTMLCMGVLLSVNTRRGYFDR